MMLDGAEVGVRLVLDNVESRAKGKKGEEGGVQREAIQAAVLK
jgi:hypothetical protein